MQETIPTNPLDGRRRDLQDENERSLHPHGALWTVIVVTLAALIAAGVYGYQTAGPYFGKANLVPAMQGKLVEAGRRIDAAEDALRNWTSQQDAWAKRLGAAEAKIDGTLRAARKQADEIAVRTQQHVQTELDRRALNLETKLDRIQSAQRLTDTNLNNLQEQLTQMQAANRGEMESLRAELRQSRDAGDATLANLNREIARVDQRSDRSRSDLESIHRKVDRERIGFELGVNHDRELAPGVNVTVSHTDILHQRFDGWVWLMPDRRTIWVHGRGLQQPLTFFNQGDDRPRELVVTRVTKYSVLGYLLVPKGSAAAAPASSDAASHSTGTLAMFDSEGGK